jgi:membrane protease YdiL (CAAX protease family)
MQIKTSLIFIFVFLLWALYRYINISVPIWIEETFVKGIIFSLPIILLPPTKKPILKTLGISRTNFLKSVYLGIAVGMVLGFSGQIGNLVRHGQFTFSTYGITSATIGSFLILSLITAFWEQLLFTGYFLSQVSKFISSEINQILIVGAGFSLIHLPALLLNQAASAQIILNLLLLFSLGVSCAILRLRLKNLIAPIMIHALWGVTIFLFR